MGVSVTVAVPLVVVMGVSGAGKTTVGTLLAEQLDVPFADADDLHSAANVAKMAQGIALTDDDRWPWLRRVGEVLTAADDAGTGLVVACSALRRAYREAILAVEPRTRFVLLDGSPELLHERMSGRSGHFMPSSLLYSQLKTLEPLAPDEPGVTVSIDQSPESIALEAAAAVG